eukprot:scaffold29716_cov61-Phaeocystis_antarctica.AAC.6
MRVGAPTSAASERSTLSACAGLTSFSAASVWAATASAAAASATALAAAKAGLSTACTACSGSRTASTAGGTIAPDAVRSAVAAQSGARVVASGAAAVVDPSSRGVGVTSPPCAVSSVPTPPTAASLSAIASSRFLVAAASLSAIASWILLAAAAISCRCRSASASIFARCTSFSASFAARIASEAASASSMAPRLSMFPCTSSSSLAFVSSPRSCACLFCSFIFHSLISSIWVGGSMLVSVGKVLGAAPGMLRSHHASLTAAPVTARQLFSNSGSSGEGAADDSPLKGNGEGAGSSPGFNAGMSGACG